MVDLPREHLRHPRASEGASSHEAFAAFIRAMSAHRQLMMRKLAEHGAHPGQMFCLKALSENDGVTQRDLAEILHVARPTVTVMVQKMEKAGLVERRVDEKDQRYTRIYLAEAGWAMHDQIHGILDDMTDVGLGSMPEQDQRELARLLGALGDNLQAAADAMPPGAHGSAPATAHPHPHAHTRE